MSFECAKCNRTSQCSTEQGLCDAGWGVVALNESAMHVFVCPSCYEGLNLKRLEEDDTKVSKELLLNSTMDLVKVTEDSLKGVHFNEGNFSEGNYVSQDFASKSDCRRLKILKFPLELLSALLRPTKSGEALRWEGLPKDVQITAAYFDIHNQEVNFQLWSSEFPVVMCGAMLKQVNVQYTSHEIGRIILEHQQMWGLLSALSDEYAESTLGLRELLNTIVPISDAYLNEVGKK